MSSRNTRLGSQDDLSENKKTLQLAVSCDHDHFKLDQDEIVSPIRSIDDEKSDAQDEMNQREATPPSRQSASIHHINSPDMNLEDSPFRDKTGQSANRAQSPTLKVSPVKKHPPKITVIPASGKKGLKSAKKLRHADKENGDIYCNENMPLKSHFNADGNFNLTLKEKNER